MPADMPLFMDLHKAADYDVKPTVEEIKRNHIADLEVQHKYGVKFLQYWINEEAGLVFCLMEAPDKESCAAVHQEAHGHMPCNVIELQGGDYMAYMGNESKANKFDIVERTDGTFDTGYRIILIADLISMAESPLSHENIDQIIQQYGGRVVNRPGTRKTIVFTTTDPAIECAINIKRHIQNLPAPTIEVRIGISAGEPVTNQDDIFADAVQLANSLCDSAQSGQVLISSLAKELTQQSALQKSMQEKSLKFLNREDEQFLSLLVEKINASLPEQTATIDNLSKTLGMSRSRLYRKITELTGYSANRFILEMRMQKALRLLNSKYGNISQVALEVGFNNPSYFSKNFQIRFGMAPSVLRKDL
jgi:AraC-like DNA-binding protein